MDVELKFRPPVKLITNVKTVILRCSMCDTELMDIGITHDTDVIWYVRCNCPYCGDKSYVTPIKGEIRYQPTEKTKMIDLITDNKTSDGKDLLEFQVIKNA